VGHRVACFAYIALSQFTDTPTSFALFAQQMTVGLDGFVLVFGAAVHLRRRADERVRGDPALVASPP
jgi:hypothetical protein